MSRLDRLFTLLSSSTSPATRQLAATQLGEVQKLHPQDLHQLLSRLHPLLRSSSWETRIAASKALAAVIKEIPPIVEEHASFENLDEENSLPCWETVLSYGQQFETSNDKQEEEDFVSAEDQLHHINSDFGFDTASKLGFSNAKDLITEDDLKTEVSLDSEKNSELSAREKNTLRRKLKTELKRGHSLNDESCSTKKQKTFLMPPIYFFNKPYDESWSGEFHLNRICECLEQDLFSHKWEIRHGAATAVREIIKAHGKSLGKVYGACNRDNYFSNGKFLLNICTKLLWLISSDRFADYGSLEVVAPVRETSSMALGATFQLLPKIKREWVVSLLLKMLQSTDWQTRLGGALGLKHYLAYSNDLCSDLTLNVIYPSILKLLCDEEDDLVGAAASAIYPIVNLIIQNKANIRPDITDLVSQLSSILSTLDDISSSTQSIMKLICTILTGLSFEKNHLLPVEIVLDLVRRSVTYLNHSNDVVRSSAIKTLSSAIKCSSGESGFMLSITPLLLPHIFQFILLESNKESLDDAQKIWFDICDLCPLEPLLVAACPVYSSWFTLVQRPPNFPFPAELLIPNYLCNESLYLGGREAFHADSDLDRKRLVMRARCFGARLLGKLACKVSTPVLGPEQRRDEKTPIEMFSERVLMPCLNSNSAYKHLATALVIIFWSELEPDQCKGIPQLLKDKILMMLSSDSHYDELQESMIDFTHQLSSFGGKLVRSFHLQNLESHDLLLTINLSEIAETKKDIAKENLQELIDEQEMLKTIHQKNSSEESCLSMNVKGLLASALVSIGALPQKLNPLIRPIMESIKREYCGETVSIVTRNLAKLLEMCIVNNNPQPTEKAIKNLMHFAASCPLIAARINRNVDEVELGIISLEQNLELENEKKTGKKSTDHRPPSVLKISNHYDGASEALRAIVSHFGTKLFESLPVFYDLTANIIQNSSEASVKDLVIALKTLEVSASSFHNSLNHQLECFAKFFVGLVCQKSALIRHLACKCLMAFISIDSLKMYVMSLVVNQVIPFFGSEFVHHRQGSIECIFTVVDGLGPKIVPFIILLVLSVLGRMADQDLHVRQVASETFATLIKLIPLESACEDKKDDLPESLRVKKQEDRKFVEELMNIKSMEQFQLNFPINVTLRTYQREGINWLSFLNRYGLHGILCDDMGLGKTLQSICILSSDHVKRRQEYQKTASENFAPIASLVICPSTLCGHWKAEIENFVEKSILFPFVFSGSLQNRQDLRTPLNQLFEKSDNLIVISSYEVIRNDIDFFNKITWNYIILDEGHAIRNSKAKTTKAVKTLKANHRLILSGTPIQNSVLELWSLFDFLMPGFLGSERQFQNRYARPIVASRGKGVGNVTKESQEAGALAAEALHRQVLPFVLRRVKDDVLKDLPPKITQDYYCELSPVQVLLYENYVKKEASSVIKNSNEGDEKKLQVHVFQLLQYLRKVCNHPKLVLNENHPQYNEIMNMLSDSQDTLDCLNVAAKLPALKQLLNECNIGVEKSQDEMPDVVNQHRVLLFCQLKSMMDIVENDLLKTMPNVTYLRMDGSIPSSSRFDLVNKFNNDPSIDIFLLSTSVGGLGLNLTGADTVIFVEHDWNPMKDLQAMDRAHRIGQKKVVNVYRLITRNTIEEKILGIQKFKLKTANTVISDENSSLETMGKGEIFDLFSLSDSEKRPKNEAGMSRSGLKSIIEGLPDMFDERLYAEEYEMDLRP